MKFDEGREVLLSSLQKQICYSFNDLEFLEHALRHKSFVHESGGKDNEKLEFLGDSIIGMLVNEYLYGRFPDYSEGELSTIKAVVVSKPILARRAGCLELGKYLLLGKGEKASGGRMRPSILANAFEALVAAVYLDSNIEECRQFIRQQLGEEVEIVNGEDRGRDYKCMLQEYAQSEHGLIPDYHVTSTNGPAHKKCFEVTVMLKGNMWGKGNGTSKKQAEKDAAHNAWQHICCPDTSSEGRT